MSPFLLKYTEQVNITICTGVNALELDSREVVIMNFGQGLRFGNRMEKSLINPNQFKQFGMKICDDPTDPHRILGIEASEELFTPMETKGSNCWIIIQPATDDEFYNCQWILLSDELDCNSSNNTFEISSM